MFLLCALILVYVGCMCGVVVLSRWFYGMHKHSHTKRTHAQKLTTNDNEQSRRAFPFMLCVAKARDSNVIKLHLHIIHTSFRIITPRPEHKHIHTHTRSHA